MSEIQTFTVIMQRVTLVQVFGNFPSVTKNAGANYDRSREEGNLGCTKFNRDLLPVIYG
jgi:hypothetical protein